MTTSSLPFALCVALLLHGAWGCAQENDPCSGNGGVNGDSTTLCCPATPNQGNGQGGGQPLCCYYDPKKAYPTYGQCSPTNGKPNGGHAYFPTGSGATCTGSVGDPVMTGFDGTRFEFVGKPNTWYNVLSETNHIINIHTISANMSIKANGQVVDSVSMRYKEHTLAVSVDAAGELAVVLDGETKITKGDLLQLPNQAFETELEEGASVVVELFRSVLGHSVTIFTPLLELTVHPTLPGLDQFYQEYLPAYLNFGVVLRDHTIADIHGILGRTAPLAAKATKTASSNASIKLFDGEGGEEAYIVSGPFSTDSKINCFGAKPVQSRPQVARRSMMEKAPVLVHVASYA